MPKNKIRGTAWNSKQWLSADKMRIKMHGLLYFPLSVVDGYLTLIRVHERYKVRVLVYYFPGIYIYMYMCEVQSDGLFYNNINALSPKPRIAK